jgi:acyl-CoA ligase (AMP-forming) (exosortase A-associated)
MLIPPIAPIKMKIQLHHLISRRAHSESAAAPAISFKETTLSYSHLWSEVLAVEQGLRNLGAARGERVAIYLDKRIEMVASVFGTSANGTVIVPINPLLRSKQVAYILDDCSVSVLVTSVERLEQLRPDLSSCSQLKHIVVVGGTDSGLLSEGSKVRLISWQKFALPGATYVAGAEQGRIDMDVAAIFYTSGSTGKPKGVVLSHRNLLVGAESVSQYLGNTNNDVILSALPLSFDAGFSQLTTAFHVGAHVVLHNYLLPEDAIKLCAKHRITGLTGVPPLWIQLADKAWSPDATKSLRYFANTGGRMPKTTLDKLRSIFPAAKPYLMYGLTEAFRSTFLDPIEVDRRPDSIGKAIPNAEILVVRPDGSLCDPNEHGELVHRGPLVSLGYWKDAERTGERFRPAPLRENGLMIPETAVWSGDVVYRDVEGFLYFVGRKDEMIKTSGYRISPTEIEEVVYDTGLVRDAVALGIEDAKLGQQIVLVVTPVAGANLEPSALLTKLKIQLPLYMLPGKILVRADLPRSPNGKFDRNLIRQELAQ